ncbi:hypothetical protein [Natrialba aegyptia]|uniref:Uncharacterized protein n=1 Tax=Natrialba aegyptia DSM 13077 TaxID=1227491 RepID=M0B4S0_9EURY|nr:hypothetical protein [Natrialba aegyptia]ELZ05825.1 hypothetical protein C480_09705 [Natrialba aegyptia DSM 13077]
MEDANANAAAPSGDESEPIRWRRDASTSRTVWALWSLGVGTFFAAISIVAFWRVYDLALQLGLGGVVLAAGAGVIATVLAFALTENTEQRLQRLTSRLPVSSPSGRGLERATDAALGTIAMMAIIVSLMVAGRVVSQNGLLGGIGAGPFTGLAAITIPLALLALVLASFLRSVGAFDREEGAIYLYDPEQAVDLDVIEAVSIRQVGSVAVLTLTYIERDGTYVAGPRRLVVPPAVAVAVQDVVESNR